MNVYGTARLVADPESKVGENTTIAWGRLAWDDGWGKNKKAVFHAFTAFGKTAETMASFLTKGKKIFITQARLTQDDYESKSGEPRSSHKVIIERFEFGDPPDGAPKAAASSQAAPAQKPAASVPSDHKSGMDEKPFDDNEDDVPF